MMKVVEVIDGLKKDKDVGDELMVMEKRMGNKGIREKDMKGLIINKEGREYGKEEIKIIGEWVEKSGDIERIIRE